MIFASISSAGGTKAPGSLRASAPLVGCPATAIAASSLARTGGGDATRIRGEVTAAAGCRATGEPVNNGFVGTGGGFFGGISTLIGGQVQAGGVTGAAPGGGKSSAVMIRLCRSRSSSDGCSRSDGSSVVA